MDRRGRALSVFVRELMGADVDSVSFQTRWVTSPNQTTTGVNEHTILSEDLRVALVAFTEAYRRDNVEETKRTAESLEGIIMMEATINGFSRAQSDKLIDQLHGLIELAEKL
ncbi:MAG TPA: hypothetical protein VLE99_06675 [Candidatus Saccharimonadales bacterium]|nr:hypothetical protein [Candidatus Saccharimonadales bacterium]